MATLRQLFCLIALTFCLTTFAQTNLKSDSTKILAPFKQKDTTYWIDNFRQFRDALFQKDKAKAKVFFDFPFKNEGNEIWYLAYFNSENAFDKLNGTVKPFTEKDFDNYFKNIFSDQLIKCLLKIKTDELYKKGKSESPELKDSSTTYKLYATYNKIDKTIELNLATNTPYKISETEYEAGESSLVYLFEILKNGHIKFKRLLIAG